MQKQYQNHSFQESAWVSSSDVHWRFSIILKQKSSQTIALDTAGKGCLLKLTKFLMIWQLETMGFVVSQLLNQWLPCMALKFL